MSRPLLVELTVEELTTAWNAMEYSFDTFDLDMMPKDDEEKAELRRLKALKDKFKQLIEDAREGRNGGR